MVAILPNRVSTATTATIAITLLSLTFDAKLIILALLETLNALPPRRGVVLLLDLLNLEVGIGGFEFGVAVEVGEVVALADAVALLAGYVGETVIFHGGWN